MSDVGEIELNLLLEAIFQRYRYDFRSYSMASLKRRVSRAMTEFSCETISGLQEKVLHDPVVFPRLLQYLTVQVSDMFRDPAYFRTLRERIVPLLKTYPSLKIWVAGCSSGEEVYSWAILLREEGLAERALIYATDINGEALRRAEAGVYPLDRVAAFTENHRLSGARGSL
ncbi:MAG: CheR family methyltransferase, partial [Polyangiales bacterium]